MRHTMLGALVVAGLVIAATAVRSSSEPVVAASLDSQPAARSSELIAHVTAADTGPQVVTVIEPRQRVMAIYHVDRSSGEIALTSVRNLTWDLQMIELNSAKPFKPQDIRSGLQQ